MPGFYVKHESLCWNAFCHPSQLHESSVDFFHLTQLGFFPRILRARSIGLIRIRRTHPFSDDAFNSAQLNPDELIQLIR